MRILLRADSGFCRDDLMSWCEANQIHYVFGLARNQRLRKRIDAEMAQARVLHEQTQQAVRVFTEFVYQTYDSWSSARPGEIMCLCKCVECSLLCWLPRLSSKRTTLLLLS